MKTATEMQEVWDRYAAVHGLRATPAAKAVEALQELRDLGNVVSPLPMDPESTTEIWRKLQAAIRGEIDQAARFAEVCREMAAAIEEQLGASAEMRAADPGFDFLTEMAGEITH